VWGVRIQAGFHDSLVFFFVFNGMKGAAFTEKKTLAEQISNEVSTAMLAASAASTGL
jgi:hypothetical protein